MIRGIILAVTATCLVACHSVPSFDLATSDKTYGAPVMRIASTMANLKCELWTAANDETELPQFKDDISLELEKHPRPEDNRRFTLKNIFNAVEYVGEIELMIDAQQTTGSNPSLSFPGLGAKVHPLTIGVDAAVSEMGHRANTTYHSVDFERLVEGSEQKRATPPSLPCGRGTELQGHLGLDDNLKMGIVASSMNDISVWPKNASNPGAGDTGVEAKYTVGQIHAVVDFTTTSSISGGPSWEFKNFVGPNSGAGLLNQKRSALNQVSFTFLPICVRNGFKGLKRGARWNYTPELPQGTPAWVNYLPPCNAINVEQAKATALGNAHETNVLSLDNIRLRAF